MYRVDWSGAEESLIQSDLLTREGAVLRLTGDGASIAERCRADHPKHLYFYNGYFTRAETSEAHARFCKMVYGRDLCQHGMMDMEQLDALIAALGLGPGSRVLELGCGNGRIAEYISDVTEAHVFMAADFASEGNLFLYRKRLIEAESHQEYMKAGMISRYLYSARLPV
jgi:SAM-dependent methyltransferase